MTSTDLPELKAKSRISIDRKVVLVEDKAYHQRPNKSLKTTNRWISRVRQPLTQKPSATFSITEVVNNQALKKRLPALIISALLIFILAAILTTVPPDSVANIILYQSYLPVLCIFWLTTYFMGKAIFITTRTAVILALFLSLLLFLKFQMVELSFLVVVVPLVFFVSLELILKLVFRK